MPDTVPPPPRIDQAVRHRRRVVAMHLQAMEGNPLDAEDIAMFEMFEREGWSHEQRRAYILAESRRPDSA